jgi:hypothetical protein
MATSDSTRAFTKSLRAQYLAADRADKFFTGGSITRAAK